MKVTALSTHRAVKTPKAKAKARMQSPRAGAYIAPRRPSSSGGEGGGSSFTPAYRPSSSGGEGGGGGGYTYDPAPRTSSVGGE